MNAQSTLNMHVDHLWLLQTDPSYMRRHAALFLAGGLSGVPKHVQRIQLAKDLIRDASYPWSWQ
jgi:hypothetical protein